MSHAETCPVLLAFVRKLEEQCRRYTHQLSPLWRPRSSQFPRARGWGLAALLVLTLGLPRPAQAQFSKGYQILLNNGLQLQGLVQWDDYFHLNTYTNAGYTSINWGWTSSPDQLSATAGFPWSRWVSGTGNMPPQNGEGPYLNRLIALQLGDEWDLNTDSTRTSLVNWFNAVQANWPNTILFHNNWQGQVLDGQLNDFIARAHPDLLCFDGYPWQCDYNTRVPIPGPPTGWYSELKRYRAYGLGYNIPYAVYRQTFNAVQVYNSTVYRNPSPSEMRSQTSLALAFNAKFMTDFTYNSGATALFDILPNGYSGDLYTNALYLDHVDSDRRAQNLARTLMCLKPVYDMHNTNDAPAPPGPGSDYWFFPDNIITSIMFIQGRTVANGATNATPLPTDFQSSPASGDGTKANTLVYSWWEARKNDPYMVGFGSTNKAAVKNNGMVGEVVVAWFNPLDESFDGTTYNNESYIMVVNALTSTNGTAADCLQEVHLDFSFGSSGITGIVMLDPETGLLQTNTLPTIPSTAKRRLTVDLNGGDAILFKFNDGAPFVGHIAPQQPKISIALQGSVPAIRLSQLTPGARYQLQSSPSLNGNNWSAVTGLLLNTSSYLYLDTSASNSLFYRAVGLP